MWEALKTAITVILLTFLIWILAERAVTQQAEVPVTIKLTSAASDILVQILDDQNNPLPETSLEFILMVQGPTAKIQAIRETYPKTIQLDVQELGYVPRDESMREYRVRVIDLLKRRIYTDDQRSYLLITGAEPEEVHFRVSRLSLQGVPVKVYDQDGIELPTEILQPEQLEAFVHQGNPVARVTLSPIQQQQAVQAPVVLTAKIDPPHRLRDSDQVRVKLPETGSIKPTLIRNPLLGVIMPMAMHGKYRVVVEDYSAYDPIECRGTPEAISRYDESDAHLLLKINESDLMQPQLQFSRTLDYYTPDEYGPIEIVNKKYVPVRFRLEKITTADTE